MIFSIGLRISKFINRVFGNLDDWTLCASLWDARLEGNRYAKVLCRLIGEQHCRNAWLNAVT